MGSIDETLHRDYPRHLALFSNRTSSYVEQVVFLVHQFWLEGGGQGFIIGAPAEATCKRLACTRNRALFLEIVPTKTLLCRNQVVREEAHALRVRVSLHFVIEGHVC